MNFRSFTILIFFSLVQVQISLCSTRAESSRTGNESTTPLPATKSQPPCMNRKLSVYQPVKLWAFSQLPAWITLNHRSPDDTVGCLYAVTQRHNMRSLEEKLNLISHKKKALLAELFFSHRLQVRPLRTERIRPNKI